MDQPAFIAPLDRDAQLRWLCSEAVVAGDGRVWSWHNPAHPGYAYPEAGGLWLAAMSRWPSPETERMRSVAAWLDRCMRAPVGVGRDRRCYAFDLGMVLAGQLAFGRLYGLDLSLLRPALASLLAMLAKGEAVRPAEPSDRWSERFGPHLLKLALPLAAATALDEAGVNAALHRLASDLPRPTASGRVCTDPNSGATYLHAHCYAAEGLWRLAEVLPTAGERADAHADATAAAHWLASVQRADGGLPAWHDGTSGWGPAPADVAAQAVRLWAGLGREHYGPAIDRALAFLARLACPRGGVRYSEHSEDRNTWATIFTVQAIDFVRGEASPSLLV